MRHYRLLADYKIYPALKGEVCPYVVKILKTEDY